jgi:hypothetical protein
MKTIKTILAFAILLIAGQSHANGYNFGKFDVNRHMDLAHQSLTVSVGCLLAYQFVYGIRYVCNAGPVSEPTKWAMRGVAATGIVAGSAAVAQLLLPALWASRFQYRA